MQIKPSSKTRIALSTFSTGPFQFWAGRQKEAKFNPYKQLMISTQKKKSGNCFENKGRFVGSTKNARSCDRVEAELDK